MKHFCSISHRVYGCLAILTLLSFASAHHDKPVGGFLQAAPSALTDPANTARVGSFGVVSSGPATFATILEPVGRGERQRAGATTDVWAHDGFAYLGTFNQPCGTGERDDAGVRIFDVRDPANPTQVDSLPSVAGSRVNDVKVAAMHSGTLLVHSNERCRGNGPGGFELYNVDDPLNPVHLAHVQTNSVNASLREAGEVDEGVHNLYLFSREGRDYVAAQVSTTIGNFQIFDVTDPQSIERVSWFGPERTAWPEVDWTTESDPGRLEEVASHLYSGVGGIANRLLHDHFVTPDGLTAYLAHWDTGLITLDLGDFAAPRVVSVALASDSEDGEVSSHAVWPSANGRVVVETEEDFHPYGSVFRILSGPNAGSRAALEADFTAPVSRQPRARVAGHTVYLGQGCEGLPEATKPSQIALFERGTCPFADKAARASNAGYAGFIVFNNAENSDEVIPMGADERVDLPGWFVGHGTGLAIAGVDDFQDLTVGATGSPVEMKVKADGWGGLRIWDLSDPENPVLASTFNTVCSAYPDKAQCDDGSVYSAHNIIVEGDQAYVSWYADGVLIVDISDPYQPVEVARYHASGSAFERDNAGAQDVWGIYKEPGKPWI